jgi:hypothetical protein
MATYTKRKPTRKRRLVENHASADSKRRLYAVYDGQSLLGTFILNERSGLALAWDSDRRFIGRFVGYLAAARGVGSIQSTAKLGVDARKAAATEARRQLLEPAEFASGLPDSFRGIRR